MSGRDPGLRAAGLRRAGAPASAPVTAAAITDATAAGRAMLTAANATAQTALLNPATVLLPGLLSAADKLLLDAAGRRVASGTYAAATSLTINLPAAGTYRRVHVQLDWDVQGPDFIALTGMAAASYFTAGFYAFATGGTGSTGSVAANSFDADLAGTASDPGAGNITFSLPPAPARKAMVYESCSRFISAANGILRNATGFSTDITNDPTAIVITMQGACSGSYTVWGDV